MHRHSPEPLDAFVLPDAPPHPNSGAWKSWGLALGAFGLFVVCSGAGFWGLGKLANLGLARGAQAGSLVYAWETPEEHLANVAAAMNAPTPGCTAAELRELSRFFGKLMNALGEDDHSGFRELVDLGAFAHRASLHPVAAASGQFDRGAMEDQLEFDLEGPRDRSQFSIVRVVRGTAPGESLVYVVFTGGDQVPTPFRWWLRRSGRNWKICDWEMIDLGHSEAARWAATRSIDGDPNNAQYWQASAALERSHDEIAAGDFGAAQAQLRDAESKQLPAAIHDLTQIELAMAWWYCGRPDAALAACDRVREPEHEIGAYYLRARALSDLERQAEFSRAVTLYREKAGCHPALLQLEAESLEAQGKRAEAAQCWWENLRLMPDDRDSLLEFCRLADDTRRAEIKQLFANSRNPVDRAVQAGIDAIQRDEAPAAAALLDYLRATAPNSPAIEQLTAMQLDYDEQHVEAAQHYLQAHKLEDQPEKKRELFRSYLSSMAAAGKAVEGYRAAEDPDQAFAYLTDGYEDEESYVADEVLAALIELHRKHKPEDARLEYLSGRLLMYQRKYAAAEVAFLKGEAIGGDADLGGLLRSGRIEAIYRQGQIENAYNTDDEARAESFRQLAWLCNADRDWPGLGELINWHRQRKPSDPWLDYFTALREQGAKNYSAAVAAVQRAETAGDDQLKLMCSGLKSELYIRSDNISQAYMSGGPPQEAFLRLANRLSDDDDWDRLLEAAQLHAAVAPNEVTSLYYATKARWHKQQYQQLVQNLTPWPTERLKAADRAWMTEIADLLVRSWLRLGQIDEARKAADLLQSEHGLDLPLLAVELAAGNRERVKELLADPILGRDLFQRRLERDREFAVLLSDPEFAELRQRYALQRPNEYGQRRAEIIILLNEPVDSARLKLEFDAAIGPEATGKSRSIGGQASDPERASLQADLPGGTLIVTSAPRPYCNSNMLPASLADDNPLRAAIEEHVAWIAIDLLPEPTGSPNEFERLGQRLAAVLCDDQALAVYASGSGRTPPHLELADTKVRDELAAGQFLQAANLSDRHEVYLHESPLETPGAEVLAWPQRRKQLRDLADRARVEIAAGHGAVRVRYSRGHAEEDLWLNVVRSKRGPYRSEEFIGELTTDSQLWPHLRTGERLRFGFYEPLDVRPLGELNGSK